MNTMIDIEHIEKYIENIEHLDDNIVGPLVQATMLVKVEKPYIEMVRLYFDHIIHSCTNGFIVGIIGVERTLRADVLKVVYEYGFDENYEKEDSDGWAI